MDGDNLFLKLLFFILFGLINSLAAMEATPSVAVNLSADAYLTSKEFKSKYKTNKNKVGSSSYNNVKFFAIEDDNNIFITFRGTASEENAKTDFNIKHLQFLDIENSKVHAGFYNIAIHSKKIFRNLIKKNKSIVVMGHSLGGAVALLLGGILHNDGYNVKVFTFGSPPVGNQIFIDSIKSLEHQRYVHIFDMIPRINKPVADKFKGFFKKKSKFGFTKLFRLPITLAFKATMYKVLNIPYEFIHHNKEIQISNIPIYSEPKNKLFSLIVKVASYHKMKTYVDGIL